MNRALSRTGVLIAALAMFMPPAALAQNAIPGDTQSRSRIEEVLVTAERRSESVLDVPITMTAFDSKLIEELGITNALDLQEQVPGLQFGDHTRQIGQGDVIRGIGSRLSGETHSDLAVATYIDGVYTVGTYGVAPSLFDLERVEVARGPQGTLHGRNSIAGAVSYFTKRPTQEWDFKIQSEFTDQFTQRYNAVVGGPIFDGLSFRISGGYYEGDGQQENTGAGDDYDAPDQISFSPQLRFQFEGFDSNLRWAHVEDKGVPRRHLTLSNRTRERPCNPGIDGNGDPSSDPNFCTGVNPWFRSVEINPAFDPDCAVGVPGFECGDLENKVNNNRTGTEDSEGDQVFFFAEYELTDTLSLRYSYGWSDVNQSTGYDGDETGRQSRSETGPGRLFAADVTGADVRLEDTIHGVNYIYDEWSHEVLLTSNFDGPFNFIVGAFTYQNDTTWQTYNQNFASSFRFNDAAAILASGVHDATFRLPFLGGVAVNTCDQYANFLRLFGYNTPGNPGKFGGCASGTDHTNNFLFSTNGTSTTRAYFASVDYEFDAQWLVTVGLRYTEDKKKQGQNATTPIIFPILGDATTGVNVIPSALYEDTTDGQTRTWYKAIGNVSVEYRPTDTQMIYARVSTGYRAGGFNTFAPGAPTDPVGDESLTNYEIGTKGQFLDQSLQLSAAIFYNTYSDYQINALQNNPVRPLPFGTTTPLIEYTSNIDHTQIWGAEFEFVYALNEQLRLSGFYSYLDSEIGNFSSVVKGDPDPQRAQFSYQTLDANNLPVTRMSSYVLPRDQTGNQLPQQPVHKFALTAAYETPFPMLGGDIRLLTTVSYTGERQADIANLDRYVLPSYYRWDARGTWTSASQDFTVTLFVQNILDELALVEFIPVPTNNPGQSQANGYLTDGRQIGLEFRYTPDLN